MATVDILDDSIQRAKDLLAAAEQTGACTGIKGGRDHCPGCSADAALADIMDKGQVLLAGYIGAVEALESEQTWCKHWAGCAACGKTDMLCEVGAKLLTTAHDKRNTALAKFEKLFGKEGK